MKKSLLIIGLFMAISSNVFANTNWTTPTDSNGTYANNMDEWIKLEAPNAKEITVTIDGETERAYDHVYIWNDDNSSRLRIFHGNINESFDVDGDSINIHFKSDYSVGRNGVTVSIKEKDNNLVVDGVVQASNMTILSPDNGIYALNFQRTDEDDRQHNWKLWHMNAHYRQNSFEIWEYKTGTDNKSCHSTGGGICTPRFAIEEGGNVGIGLTNPQRTLHIKDVMRLEPQSNTPSGGMGDLYVGTNGELYFHNGTDWKQIQLVP